MSWPSRSTSCLLSLLLLFTWACEGGDPEASPVRITSFSATPLEVGAREATRLSWSTENAASISLLRDGIEVEADTALPLNGTIEVRIDETSVFELVAEGAGGPARRSLTVTLLGAAPSIGGFFAPDLVGADERGIAAATLSWTEVLGADELLLEAAPLGSLLLSEEQRPHGSAEVELAVDTEVVLIARNPWGETRASAWIRVVPLPTIERLGLDRSWVGLGEEVRIEWEVSGASSIGLWADGIEVEPSTGLPTTGSFTFSPQLDTTIELRAFNEVGAVVSRSVEAVVAPPVILSFESNPLARWLGQSLILSWESRGGSALEIRPLGDEAILCQRDELEEISLSSCDLGPYDAGEYEFTLLVSNGSGIAASDLRVAVVGSGPLILDLEATPEKISLGESSTLRWLVGPDPEGELPQLSLVDDLGTVHPISQTAEGELHVSPLHSGKQLFRLEASTSHPLSLPAEATVELDVFGVPEASLTASHAVFDELKDEAVVFTWTSRNADTLVLHRLPREGEPTVLYEIPELERSAGSLSYVPTTDATYRLVATNGAGASHQEERDVLLAPPRILSFQAEPTTVVAGEPVLLRWETTSAQAFLDILRQPYLREEIDAPFLDLETEGGSRLPMGTDCSPSAELDSCALLVLPDGFAFPFDGQAHRQLRVYTSGYVSFDGAHLGGGGAAPEEFPTGSGSAHVHLAPLWHRLAWDPLRHPEGNIRYLHRVDPSGDSVVIEWKDIGFADPLYRSLSSLDFQLVLWGDGSFEFRYGEMEFGTAPTSWKNGDMASIGFQAPGQGAADTLNFVPIRGPIEQRSFRYSRTHSLPPSGSLLWHPFTTEERTSVELLARRDGQEDRRTIPLTVLQGPSVELTQRPKEPVLTGEPVRVGWRTGHALELVILDEGGSPICSAGSQTEVNEFFCTITHEREGVHPYRVRATGARGATIEKTFSITAFDPFEIETFESDDPLVEYGQGVVLSWRTSNARTISLTASGQELLPAGAPSGPGSMEIPRIEETTTFTLTITNSVGMSLSRSVTVEMWKVALDLLPSSSRITPGTPLTIDVDVKAFDGGGAPIVYGTLPLREESGPASSYRDISSDPGAIRLWNPPTDTSTVHDVTFFDPGFSFPYFGKHYFGLRIFVDGYVSFDSDAMVRASNRALPDADDGYGSVHLAPFWDDLHPRADALGDPQGEIWIAQPSPETFIVQWSRMSMADGSSDRVHHDLNFQLVLHRSGAFEYRYGTMEGLKPPATSPSCHPTSCANEASASSATIGYQIPGGAYGLTLHHGGTSGGPYSPPFPGGLSNRSFRSQPLQGPGLLTFMPSRSATYLFCSLSGATPLCKELEVEVDFGVERFEAPASIDFGTEARLSWKTLGGQELIVRQAGVEPPLLVTSDPAVMAEGSLAVEPSSSAEYLLELKAPGLHQIASSAIEVVRLRLASSASATSVFPGAPVTLSWTLTKLDPQSAISVIKPMVEVTGRAFSEFDLRDDPDAAVLIGGGTSVALPHLHFADGFTFPYLGREMSQVRVSSEGYLSFDLNVAAATPHNQMLPDDSPAFGHAHLAVFWDDLHMRSNGRVLAKKVGDDRYVIQWSHVSLNRGSSPSNQGDLNFMVVLHRDGGFEYRFGAMEAPPLPAAGEGECYPASCVNETNGSSATIGYQEVSGTAASVVHYGGTFPSDEGWPIVGGLSGRSWEYRPAAASGSVQVFPADTSRYEICVVEGVLLEIYCAPPIEVQVDWGISSFEVSSSSIATGASIDLTWDVSGLDQLSLSANGVLLETHLHPSIPGTRQLTHTPATTTTYVLEGVSLGRVVREEREVLVRSLILEIEEPQGRLLIGDKATVGWNVSPLVPGHVSLTNPMTEVKAGPGEAGEYRDIQSLTGASKATFAAGADHAVIALPFGFPYFGSSFNQLQIYEDGYLSFDVQPEPGTGENTRLPSHDPGKRVHLAPFWDDLIRRGAADSIWTHQLDPETFVIQFTSFNRAAGSSPTSLYDLNFQVVLLASGAFEYRYGKMSPPQTPSSSCHPTTCALEANGSSATIGYQLPGRVAARTFHYGGEGSSGVVPLPGGLEGRTLRFEPATSGSMEVSIGGVEELAVCASVGGVLECSELVLQPEAAPGELMFTELMLDPEEGSGAQWFELRNLSRRTIDLEGFTLSSDSGSHRIDRPLVVGPGELLTFAPAAREGFTPNHGYGSGFSLNPKVDRLRIAAGTATIASVGWGVSWIIPTGKTLALDPSFHVPGVAANDDASRWCEGTADGSPAALGAGCKNPHYDVDPASPLPFIDISAIGTPVPSMQTLFGVSELTIPGFSMPFFDSVVEETIWVSSNGWLSFSKVAPGGEFNPAPMPGGLPRGAGEPPQGPLVSLVWDTLLCDAFFACDFRYHHGVFGDQEMLILQWTRSLNFSSPIMTFATFQAQLWKDGTVVLAFGDMVPDEPEPAWSSYLDVLRGGLGWVGLEGPTGAYVSGQHRTVQDLHRRSFRFIRR